MLGGITGLSSVASTPSTSVAPPAVAPTPTPDDTPTPSTTVAPPSVAPTPTPDDTPIPNDQQTLGGVQETSPSPRSYDLLLITTGLLSAVSVGFAMMLRKRAAKKEIEA